MSPTLNGKISAAPTDCDFLGCEDREAERLEKGSAGNGLLKVKVIAS